MQHFTKKATFLRVAFPHKHGVYGHFWEVPRSGILPRSRTIYIQAQKPRKIKRSRSFLCRTIYIQDHSICYFFATFCYIFATFLLHKKRDPTAGIPSTMRPLKEKKIHGTFVISRKLLMRAFDAIILYRAVDHRRVQ